MLYRGKGYDIFEMMNNPVPSFDCWQDWLVLLVMVVVLLLLFWDHEYVLDVIK